MQTKALTEAGADRIWTERMSGARDDRPELAALLGLRPAAVTCSSSWRLDRLGRSLPHLLTVASDLQDRGVELRSLTEAIDTSTAGGRRGPAPESEIVDRLVFNDFLALLDPP